MFLLFYFDCNMFKLFETLARARVDFKMNHATSLDPEGNGEHS